MRHQLTFKLIDAIARAGSIRRAAEKMLITPSALNRRLLALEGELGVQLFERTTKGVRLSTAGELIIEHARRQIADMDRIRSIIEDLKGARWGNIKIALDTDFTSPNLSVAIAEYRTKHPAVSFHITRGTSEEMIGMLERYDVDLAVTVNLKQNPACGINASAPIAINALVAKNHPLTTQSTVRVHELAYYPLVMPRMGSLRQILRQTAIRHSLKLDPMIEGELALAHQDLIRNDAVGFTLSFELGDHNAPPDLVSIPIEPRDLPKSVIQIVQLSGRTPSVTVNRFNEMLVMDFAKFSDDA